MVHLFGIKLVGFTPENGRKLLFTLALLVVIVAIRAVTKRLLPVDAEQRRASRFWLRQGVSIALFVTGAIGMLSIWFDDPRRLTTGLGLMTAGLAFALQRVVMSFAAYLIIIRGTTFRVGDRIVMGGVRGDVVRLGFMQTHIMEMGQPPSVSPDTDPAMWVRSRQYTGRIVTVTNDKIFDEPVYNYTREFPYLWEEMRVPVPYTADRPQAERILLEAARRNSHQASELGEQDLAELRRRYGIATEDLAPRVYWRLTDNWLELTVRFLVSDHGMREIKDRMTREILDGFDRAGIQIASATFEVVGLPPLRLAGQAQPSPAAAHPHAAEDVPREH